MKSTFSIIFYLKRQVVKKDGTVPVMGRITVDGTQAQFSCKTTANPNLWDTKGGRMIGKSMQALEVNRKLDKMRVSISKHYQEIMDRDNFVTADKVKNAFLGLEYRCHTLMKVYSQSRDEIEKQYDFLMDHGGPFNIQLSGGEPTMREDLPEIIHMGREKGFTFFQLNTNGIRLAQEAGYARKLKKAGLNTVFLQFDGVTDDVYQTLRGRSMIELKEKAVLNCSEAELGIALVPVIAPGVNDMQVGDILKFAMDHMPFVRGVHFQPISYFGRCSQQRPQAPITIPKMLKLIEEQTDGLMKSKDFAGGGAEHPYCSFHASYLKKGERELKLLEKKSGRGCCCTTSDNSRQYVENQWSYSTKKFDDGEMTQTDALDEFLIRVHNETFAVSGMIFQDAWNLDLERLKRCYICEVDSDYGMVPFCAYNLTNSKGIYLYRK